MVKQIKSTSEQEESKRKKKAKKGKKEYSNGKAAHKYFNIATVPTDISMEVLLQSMIDRAEEILKEHDLSLNIWCTFKNLHDHVIAMYETDFFLAVETGRHIWMDSYINEIGFMIWNEVNRKYHSEWFKTGVLIDVPGLVKRARNGEGVAEHFSNEAVEKFEETYL